MQLTPTAGPTVARTGLRSPAERQALSLSASTTGEFSVGKAADASSVETQVQDGTTRLLCMHV